VDVRFAPFFLDPTTPPEGKPRRAMTNPGDPPTHLEQRGEQLGIGFTRGRTWTSNSHLALEAAEFTSELPQHLAFHRAMFKAYFGDLEDIGKVDTLVRIGEGAGLDSVALRHALETGEFRQQVDDGINWSRQIGVTAVPTFVFDEQYGVVGAQEYNVFQDLMGRLGKSPRK
jgi:predicted DsbA family dithiol-disulfide isomerase